MRRMLVVLGCLCALTAPAWAGGDVAILGAYGETAETDASLGLGARISVGSDSFRVDLTSTWFRQASVSMVPAGGAAFTEEITLTPLELGVRFVLAPGSELRPYVGAGASYFLVSTRLGEADDELGYYVSAGFVWGPPRGARMFGEVVYRAADVTATYGSVGRLDLDVGGLGAAVGVSFAF